MRSFVQVRSFPPEISNVPLSAFGGLFAFAQRTQRRGIGGGREGGGGRPKARAKYLAR